MMMPSVKTIIIGCVDPRVDPAQILGIDLGEVAVIRNIGGRVTAATVQELALLRKLTQARGSDLDQGWDLIILQHTDCGIVRLQCQPEMLADYLNTSADALAGQNVAAPRQPSNSTSPPSEPPPLSRAGCVSPGSSTTWRQDKSKPLSRHQHNYPPKAD
jgi:Carbonic anhydrase